MLEVADTGVGIPEEDRASRSSSRSTPPRQTAAGPASGLSVAHGIVKDHDGWIEIDEQRQGPGTVFRVFLPEERAA